MRDSTANDERLAQHATQDEALVDNAGCDLASNGHLPSSGWEAGQQLGNLQKL